ncbi:hypothetical protein I3760_06G013400 [Carya illinoinensis]|nr:hypothetical protein I3760_06G013400 [Carya illinoinensis]
MDQLAVSALHQVFRVYFDFLQYLMEEISILMSTKSLRLDIVILVCFELPSNFINHEYRVLPLICTTPGRLAVHKFCAQDIIYIYILIHRPDRLHNVLWYIKEMIHLRTVQILHHTVIHYIGM